MWLLHRAYPGAVPPGHQGPATEELVRLRPSASLAFPPGDLELFEDLPSRPPFRLTTTFMGLYGAHSPLPSFYAEEIAKACADDENHITRLFLDIFNHRILSLLYRGILKYRGHLIFAPDAADEFSWRLFAIAGLSPEGVTSAAAVPGQRLLRYTGLLSQKPRSAESLRAVLASWYDGLRVAVAQCTPRWVYLGGGLRSALGQQSCQLGNDATIGSRIRDWTGKFRVRIGPVDFTTYQSFLPGSANLRTLHNLVSTASGDALDHDVELVIRKEDTPQLGIRLARSGKLGWTTGLFSRPGQELSVVLAAAA
jgi:type VI secretion system protein ImpH